jgi:hypothetical protein
MYIYQFIGGHNAKASFLKVFAFTALLVAFILPSVSLAVSGTFVSTTTVANVTVGADNSQGADFSTIQANVTAGTNDQTFVLANVTVSSNASLDDTQSLTSLTTTPNAGAKATDESTGADGAVVTATNFGSASNGISIVITDNDLTECNVTTLQGTTPNYTIDCNLDASSMLTTPLSASALTSLIDGASDLTAVVKGTGSNTVVADTITLAGGVDAVAQVNTFTPGGAIEVGDTFSITINGTQYDYVATAGTVQNVVEGLKPLVDAHAAVSCTEDDTAVTCTADSAGTSFTASSVASNKPAIAQVDDITPSNIEQGDSFTVTDIATSPVTVVASNSSASTLVDALVTAINTAPGKLVTASNVANKLRLTGDTPGVSFTATPSTNNRAAATQVNKITITGTVEVGDIFKANLPTVGWVEYIATTASIFDTATGLNTAVQTSSGYASQDFTTSVSSNEITFTAKNAGTGFTLSSNQTNRPAVAQETTFTPANIADGETFRATINGGSNLDYTVTGSESVQDVVEGIVSTMDGEPAVSCSEDNTKVTCTADSAGTSFTFSSTVVDITAPTVVITDNEAGTANIAGGDITYTFTFSEPVTGFTVPEVTVVGGTKAGSFATGSDGSSVYTLVVTPDSNSTSDITVDVAGGVATDAATNANTAATQSVQTVDTQTPTISTITSNATLAGILKIGDTITFTLTPGITEVGATVSGSYNGASLVWSTGDAGATYTGTYTVVSGETDRTTALQITGVTITDAAGNQSASAGGSDILKTIDANVPTLVSARTNTTDTIDLTFSEDLLGASISNSDFSVTGSSLTSPDATEVTDGVVRLTLSSPIASDATPTVSYGGSVTDTAGNVAPTAGPITPSDGIAPSVVITDDEAGVANIAGGDVTYTFTFSESVTGFDDTDVSVAGGSKGAFNAVSGTVYTLVVTPTSASTANITVDVAGSVAVDGNSNNNTAATQSVQAVDTLRPTLSAVTISSNNASSTRAKVGNVITLNFTSSESISTPTVTVDGGSASVSGSTTTWSATYTMQSGDNEGALAFTIDHTDLNANTGTQVTAVTSGGVVRFDKTAPVITLTGLATSTISKGGAYSDDGATANDGIDGDITNSIATTSSVNVDYVGTYEVTYNVSDASGNAATQVVRIVKVKNSSGGGSSGSSSGISEPGTTELVGETIVSLPLSLAIEIPVGATNDEVVAILKTHLVSLLAQLVAQLQIELNAQ